MAFEITLLMCVYIERTMHQSSAQPARCGTKSEKAMPLWPCLLNFQGLASTLALALAQGADWVWLADDDGRPQDTRVLLVQTAGRLLTAFSERLGRYAEMWKTLRLLEVRLTALEDEPDRDLYDLADRLAARQAV